MKSREHSSADEEKLRKKEDVLEELLHTLPVGVAILGEDKVPLYSNDALKRILKLSKEEFNEEKYRERKYFRADGSEMPPSEFPSTRVFKEGKAIRDVEIGILTADGEKIWTTVSALPFEHDEWRVVLTTTDITQQKEFELALKKKTAALSERVKELNCLFGIANLVEQPNITFDEILQGTANLIPPSWHYPPKTSARIIYEGREFISEGFRASKRKQSEVILTHGVKSGSIEVFLDKHAEPGKPLFLKEEDALLYAIAERLGRIAERFKAEQRLLELATTDPLTQLYNRRHFFNLAKHEIARAKRYQRPITCIMVDIDYFKEINDSYGHLFGDQVLKKMVERCQQNIRKVDIFARYGGDEFVMLLPEADHNHGCQLAQRLSGAFQDHPIQINEQEVSVSMSLGVASMSGDEKLTLDTLLIHADEALYAAKNNGRNQTALWGKDT